MERKQNFDGTDSFVAVYSIWPLQILFPIQLISGLSIELGTQLHLSHSVQKVMISHQRHQYKMRAKFSNMIYALIVDFSDKSVGTPCVVGFFAC